MPYILLLPHASPPHKRLTNLSFKTGCVDTAPRLAGDTGCTVLKVQSKSFLRENWGMSPLLPHMWLSTHELRGRRRTQPVGTALLPMGMYLGVFLEHITKLH